MILVEAILVLIGFSMFVTHMVYWAKGAEPKEDFYLSMEGRVLHTIAVLRLLRIIPLLSSSGVTAIEMIVKTLTELFKPFSMLFFVQLSIFYAFNVIGESMFGGIANVNTINRILITS